jgi:NADPH:quinone reductase-like Zn-dependent oxidoreductase
MNKPAETMRAAVYRAYGGPDVVKIESVPRPVPKQGEVLIRIHASTVSAGDMRLRSMNVPKGWGVLAPLVMGVFGPRKPILGTDLAGVVAAVGPGVTAYAVGDRVVAYPGIGLGAHAEYRTMPVTGALTRLPDNLSFEQGASVGFGGLTALYFLRDGAKLKAGETVLVIGASGAVGSAGVQLAKYLGATVTGVTSTSNVERVRALGANHVIDYTQADTLGTGDRYDVIFEVVGQYDYARAKASLNEGGRFCLCVGSLPDMFGGLTQSMGTSHKVIVGSAAEKQADLVTLVELAASGRMVPPIDRVFPLEQICDAHAYVDTGRKRGSVVVTMV